MKYFSRGWAAGEFDDATADQMRSAYWERIKALRHEMPEAIAELATATALHDGLVDRVVWDCRRRTLEFNLACGDSGTGYFGVRLIYSDVRISEQAISLLADRVRDRRTGILYDEIDRDDDGLWTHRLLLWPVGEVSIWFGRLDLSRTSRTDKRWEHVGCDPFVFAERSEGE